MKLLLTQFDNLAEMINRKVISISSHEQRVAIKQPLAVTFAQARLLLSQVFWGYIQRRAEGLYSVADSLNYWALRQTHGTSAKTVVEELKISHHLPPDVFQQFERNRILSKVTDSFLNIRDLMEKYRKGQIDVLEIFDCIIDLAAHLGISQVIGWKTIQAGRDADLPNKIITQYQHILDDFGQYSETEKARIIDSISAYVASGESRQEIALFKYAAGLAASQNLVRLWGTKFASDLLSEGIQRLGDQRSVLRLVAESGFPCLVLDSKNTQFSPVQDPKKVAILNAMGLSSYAILPIRRTGKDLPIIGEDEAADFLASVDFSKNMGFHPDVIGVVHLLIDEREKKDEDLLLYKIKTTQLFLNMAAQALAGVDHDVDLLNNQRLLKEYTTSLVGEEHATLAFERIERGEGVINPGRLVQGTILFTDIKGFTRISELFQNAQKPSEFLNYLNRYLTEAAESVKQNGGTIRKFMGDAFMASFMRSGSDAVRSALELRSRVVILNERIKIEYSAIIEKIRELDPSFTPEIVIRTGIKTGLFMDGTVGSSERFEEGAIGTTPNIASRLEAIGSFFGAFGRIIIAEDTKLELEKDNVPILVRKLYPIVPINSAEMLPIYDVVGLLSEITNDERTVVELNNKAIDALLKGQMDAAETYFKALIQIAPKDPFAVFYLDRLKTIHQAKKMISLVEDSLSKEFFNDPAIAISDIHGYLVRKGVQDAIPLISHLHDFLTLSLSEINLKQPYKLVDVDKFNFFKEYWTKLKQTFRKRDQTALHQTLEHLRMFEKSGVLADFIQQAYEQNEDIFDLDYPKFFYPSKKE